MSSFTQTIENPQVKLGISWRTSVVWPWSLVQRIIISFFSWMDVFHLPLQCGYFWQYVYHNMLNLCRIPAITYYFYLKLCFISGDFCPSCPVSPHLYFLAFWSVLCFGAVQHFETLRWVLFVYFWQTGLRGLISSVCFVCLLKKVVRKRSVVGSGSKRTKEACSWCLHLIISKKHGQMWMTSCKFC